jgi:hypothetical protein
MSGFGDAKVRINTDELNNIIKRYKKAKKYMKSTLFTVKTLDGTESYISGLIKEAQDDPPVN